MKITEIHHAWHNKHMTDRREAFLWNYEMIAFLRPELVEPLERSGQNPKLRAVRLCQGETPPEVRKNPTVLQWVVVDRQDECVRYGIAVLAEGAPPLKEMLDTAVTVEAALAAFEAEV